MTDIPQEKKDVLTAALNLLGHTGAASTEIRYQDDQKPTVWMAIVKYEFPEGVYYEAAGGMNPLRAVLRLCEIMIDGGTCTHCNRPAGFEPDSIDEMPADSLLCWYQYDPELKVFRRGCEGDG